jgi:glycine cleavage system transcriptional repressor
MKKYMILFSVGKDRPGIVDEVSTLLFEQGANIEDSRMAAMGGRFSIMTLFSCTSEQLENIKVGLLDLRKLGLETSLHEAEDPTATPTQPAMPLKFEVQSMDHPGIVQKIVHLLHQHNVNIKSLNTQVARAPLSGAPLFDLTLEADVPVEKPIAKAKDELMELAAQMNLDLNFKK